MGLLRGFCGTIATRTPKTGVEIECCICEAIQGPQETITTISLSNNWLIMVLISVIFFISKIRNIQNVLRLTKENLESLNAEFGKQQHPPSMYLAVSLNFLESN